MANNSNNDQRFVIAGSDKSNDFLSYFNINVDKCYINTDQILITITEDKLRLCLNNHQSCIEKHKDWIAPLSVIISLILALVSSDFKDYILSKNTWSAVFIILTFLTFVWFLVTIRNALWKRTVDMLISEIKEKSNKILLD